MNSKLNALKVKFFDWSLIRWALVGLLTNALDYLIFIFLYHRIEMVVISNFVSTFIATSINYLTHHKWTFNSNQNHLNSGLKYVINLIFWWIITTISIKLLIVTGVSPKIAKLLPLAIIAPINYFVLNHLVFKKNA
jgi:putative flippase GtrA